MELKRLNAAYQGSLSGDALAMPVHWYYDREALKSDYGTVDHFVAPKSSHSGSFMGKSSFKPVNEKANILHEQAQYWGKPLVHYHQFLKAGENTLNLRLARELHDFVIARDGYNANAWLEHYVACMLKPGWHHDTYVEGYHRGFFQNYAQGKKLRECGVDNYEIGGMSDVPALVAAVAASRRGISVQNLESIVEEHISIMQGGNPLMIDAALALTRVLCAVAEGGSLRASIHDHASAWLSGNDAESWLNEKDNYVIGTRFKASCPIKESMPSSLYLAWKYQGDFAAGITANAMAGGDNCHRGAVVGSLLGSAKGDIPQRLRVKHSV